MNNKYHILTFTVLSVEYYFYAFIDSNIHTSLQKHYSKLLCDVLKCNQKQVQNICTEDTLIK